ncbi:hypothetical protein [Dokdonella soli]|uniref:hypothetical protein n=1 Tax=Dokdonella soli TaxID=529810 RepID=UPI0031D19DFD
MATLILASFGGGAVIVIGLATWLGNLWASRILQAEKAALDAKLESLRHEMRIVKSAYEHHLDLILDYYSMFYRHYRLCQRTARADARKEEPDGKMVETKDEFMVELREIINEWASREGRIRLLLPATLLALHEEAIGRFNEFNRAVADFTSSEPSPRKKEQVFIQIEDTKSKLEAGLREFLRTESLLKEMGRPCE